MRVWLNGIVSDMVRIRQGCVIGWVSTGTYGAHSFPRGKLSSKARLMRNGEHSILHLQLVKKVPFWYLCTSVSLLSLPYLSPFLIRPGIRRATFPPGEGFFAVPSHYKTFIFKSYNLLQAAHSNPFTSAKAETPRFCLSFPNSCRSQAISWRKGLSMRQLTVSR